MKGNYTKKSASTTKDKEKSTGTEIVKPKIFNLSIKTLSRYQKYILLWGL